MRFVAFSLLCILMLAGCGARSFERESQDAALPDRIPLDTGPDAAGQRDANHDLSIDARLDVFADALVACTSRRECDDRRFCNGAEDCVGGRCVAGAMPNCDDRVACTDDRCDEAQAACISTVNERLCVGGQRCDAVRGCISTRCVSDLACDDGIYCNGIERCLAGTCASEMPRLCDDSNRCTMDICDENTRACRFERIDMDGDGFAPQSCGANDCNDRNPNVHPGVAENCNDRIDNNCNGLTDCAEPSCAMLPACCRPMMRERCDNGVDDNCNGLIDCADRMCSFLPRCRAVDAGIDAGGSP